MTDYRAQELGARFPAAEMTEATRRVYDMLVAYKRDNDGVSPTLRGIAAALGIGKTTVAYQLNKLEYLGFIKRDLGRRTINVIGGRWAPPEGWDGEDAR